MSKHRPPRPQTSRRSSHPLTPHEFPVTTVNLMEVVTLSTRRVIGLFLLLGAVVATLLALAAVAVN